MEVWEMSSVNISGLLQRIREFCIVCVIIVLAILMNILGSYDERGGKG